MLQFSTNGCLYQHVVVQLDVRERCSAVGLVTVSELMKVLYTELMLSVALKTSLHPANFSEEMQRQKCDNAGESREQSNSLEFNKMNLKGQNSTFGEVLTQSRDKSCQEVRFLPL